MDRCGCNSCFLEFSKQIEPLTPITLRNAIRTFMESREKSGLGALCDHPANCMCVNHLLYYKKQKTKIIDNFLERHPKTSPVDQAASSANSDTESGVNKPCPDTSIRPKMTRSKGSKEDSQPIRSSAESLPSLS